MAVTELPLAFRQFLSNNGICHEHYQGQVNADVPRFIRLNPFEVIDLCQLAAQLGCAIVPTVLSDFFALPGHVKIATLDSYINGQFYGIDLASGIAVDNLDLESLTASDVSVLDLCCAPGAKLSMICDRLGRRGHVVGVDINQSRLNVTCRQFREKYSMCSVPGRADFKFDLICASGVGFAMTERSLFDFVVVDAECTHDGSLKHIVKFCANGWDMFEKRFLNPERIAEITQLQRQLILSGFHLLRHGGVLIYSTCSFCVAQNEDIVRWLLETEPSATMLPLSDSTVSISSPGHNLPLARRLDPIFSNTSALFIAKIRKSPFHSN